MSIITVLGKFLMIVLQKLSMPSFIDVLWNFITIYVKLTYKLYFDYSYYDTLLFETLTKEVTESTLSTLLICLHLLRYVKCTLWYGISWTEGPDSGRSASSNDWCCKPSFLIFVCAALVGLYLPYCNNDEHRIAPRRKLYSHFKTNRTLNRSVTLQIMLISPKQITHCRYK